MTLDLTVVRDTPHRLNIGYRTFAEYRRLLARDACGIDLDAMHGFGGERPWPSHETVPLRHLLEHSDCDGWLYQCECEDMMPVLLAFRPAETWPTWARDLHSGVVRLIEEVAEGGGSLRFH